MVVNNLRLLYTEYKVDSVDGVHSIYVYGPTGFYIAVIVFFLAVIGHERFQKWTRIC